MLTAVSSLSPVSIQTCRSETGRAAGGDLPWGALVAGSRATAAIGKMLAVQPRSVAARGTCLDICLEQLLDRLGHAVLELVFDGGAAQQDQVLLDQLVHLLFSFQSMEGARLDQSAS